MLNRPLHIVKLVRCDPVKLLFLFNLVPETLELCRQIPNLQQLLPLTLLKLFELSIMFSLLCIMLLLLLLLGHCTLLNLFLVLFRLEHFIMTVDYFRDLSLDPFILCL